MKKICSHWLTNVQFPPLSYFLYWFLISKIYRIAIFWALLMCYCAANHVCQYFQAKQAQFSVSFLRLSCTDRSNVYAWACLSSRNVWRDLYMMVFIVLKLLWYIFCKIKIHSDIVLLYIISFPRLSCISISKYLS